MSDTIDRQDAIRWIKTESNPYGKPTLDFESGKKVIEHLEQMPSVDAVEVVRCKYCEYYPDPDSPIGRCKIRWDYIFAGDFCSYGIRREK